jgi:hypothetical protein
MVVSPASGDARRGGLTVAPTKERHAMTRLPLFGLAALFLSATGALALSTQDLIDRYAADGFTRIEVKSGPTQTKVEAIRGTEKVEVVYDNASGSVLKREVEALAPGTLPRTGIEVDTRNRDFVRPGRSDDRVARSDDDDNGRRRGRGSDDSHDDDRDDDRDDSRSDDRGGDDNGGRGRGRGRGGDD